MSELPRDIEHELAALADGSLLAPERREQASTRAEGSPELAQALAEQRRAVGLTAAVEVKAPASLHRQVEAMLTPGRRGRRPARARFGRGTARFGRGTAPFGRGTARLDDGTPRPDHGTPRFGHGTARLGFAAVAAVVVVAGVVAIGLSGGGSSSGLNVKQAAALTLSPATMAAPAEDETHRAQLEASVDGISFPYWKERFGWRSSGARNDRVGGRAVTTVFYSNAEGRRIGYAIATGRAPTARGGTVVKRWGVQYRVLSQDGATVVSWERDGHLCVVGGRGVSAHTLLGLASWGSERRQSA
ncbi:MAG TPA: hypothetical protein VK672_03110 [Solirubrobacteraceae bacterium]|jgi:hypothetical protein|nr:hypothetical protein [Solirubrobacteraceae bacterium]